MDVQGPRLSKSFDWHGTRVAWDRFGEGPPVVLCHGTPWSSFVWRDLVEALRADHTVHVWDMVGYGQSAMVDGDVSLDTQGQLLAALVEHWGLDAPAVVAHDFGGAVSLRAHLLHDMAVSSLALIDIVALRPWGSPFFLLVQQHADVFAALPPNLHEALVREYISGASAVGLADDVLAALVAPWTTAEGQPAFYRQIAQADERFTEELEPRFGSIDVPVLIAWGTDDMWIPIDRADRLAAAIPHATVERIEHAGHLVQEDQPERLREVITDWLR